MRNNIQNSARWTFETISATICNLPGNVPNNYYFGGFEFDLHKALDFAFRLRNEKNIMTGLGYKKNSDQEVL